MPSFRSLALSLALVTAATALAAPADNRLRVTSPDGQITFIFGDASITQTLQPAVSGMHYSVDFHGKWLMDESILGLQIEGQPALGPGMHQVSVHTGQTDDTYTIPVGKTSSVRDHYNSALVDLEDDARAQALS